MGESIPPWGRQGTAVPQCHPGFYGTSGGTQRKEGQPAMEPAWHEGPCWHHSSQTTAWPCPVAWPRVHLGDSIVLPAILCSPQGAAPLPSPQGAPILAGAGNGASLASVHTRLLSIPTLGRLLVLVTFHSRVGNTSAELSTASASRPFLCLAKDTALVLLAAPWDSWGLWGATSRVVTVPPERKQSDGPAELHLSAQGRFALLLNPPKPNIPGHGARCHFWPDCPHQRAIPDHLSPARGSCHPNPPSSPRTPCPHLPCPSAVPISRAPCPEPPSAARLPLDGTRSAAEAPRGGAGRSGAAARGARSGAEPGGPAMGSAGSGQGQG